MLTPNDNLFMVSFAVEMGLQYSDKIKLPHPEHNRNARCTYLRISSDLQHAFGGRRVRQYSPGHDDPILACRAAKPFVEGRQRKMAQGSLSAF